MDRKKSKEFVKKVHVSETEGPRRRERPVIRWKDRVKEYINASKTQFLQLSTRHNLPDNYSLFFNDTQLTLSSTLNTLGLSFTKNLDWQFHISC